MGRRREAALSVSGYFREAWSQALVAVSDAGDEVQSIVQRMTDFVQLGPDEARRLTTELAERLRQERAELERSIDSAMERALLPFKRPTREEFEALDRRLDAIEARIDALIAARSRAVG